MERLLQEASVLGRLSHPSWTPFHVLGKLTEESGELAEAVIAKEYGTPEGPEHEEHVIEEAADVVLCAFDLASRCHPELTPEQLVEKFKIYLETKTNKWRSKYIEA